MKQPKDWGFLDNMDKNLLYLYAKSLAKPNSKAFYQSFFNAVVQTGNDERDEHIIAEKKCEAAYYLIWFVYRHILNCATLADALVYADETVLRRFKLTHFFEKRCLFIGVYGIDEIYLYKYKENDLKIVLEILYKKYNFFQQLECFLKKTEGTGRTTRKRCIQSSQKYLDMIRKNPEYSCVIENLHILQYGENV